MKPAVSVIIPTHSPRVDILAKVFACLENQTLPSEEWELILIDSASKEPILVEHLPKSNLSPSVIRLEEAGLTTARLKGIESSTANLIVFVDDDNLLDEDYLENAVSFMKKHKDVGTAGGIIEGEFETHPPAWIRDFYPNLALRNLGATSLISEIHKSSIGPVAYPHYAPVGAGMVLTRRCAELYVKRAYCTGTQLQDRVGKQLSSGGDCDINFIAILGDYQVAYCPDLKLKHYIPRSRLTRAYLSRLLYSISRSWVAVLAKHDSCAWPVAHPWLGPIRRARVFFRYRAYLGAANWVRWREACGFIDGRSDLYIPESTTQSLRFLLKELQLGKLLHLLVHGPLRTIKQVLSRGLQLSFAMKRGEQQMRASATSLIVPSSSETTELTVNLLTGNKFWHQTLYCLYSLGTCGHTQFSAYLYDDGSLTIEQQNILKRALPRTTIIEKSEINEAIRAHLPESKFPILRRLRKSYPHIRKLTDVHTQPGSWKLVLDSDMLFFKRPEAIVGWYRDPQTPIFMEDKDTYYGYPLDFMAELASNTIPEKINVGVIGLSSSDIDWGEVEHWCHRLLEKHGQHYFLEQAITAMLVSRFANKVQLHKDTYLVGPNSNDTGTANEVILKHYVSDSKSVYFTRDWLAIQSYCQQENT